jgi:hypothetical protein
VSALARGEPDLRARDLVLALLNGGAPRGELRLFGVELVLLGLQLLTGDRAVISIGMSSSATQRGWGSK